MIIPPKVFLTFFPQLNLILCVIASLLLVKSEAVLPKENAYGKPCVQNKEVSIVPQ